jgi:CHASE2 domain-containing sensor protein
MILLRFLSFLAGALVLVSPALFMSGGSDGRTVFGTFAGLALVAAAFVFVGVAGRKIRKSPRLRAITGALLAVPFMGGMGIMWRGAQFSTLWASALLCSFVAVLFITFVFPAQHARKHRPMRRREPLAS